MLDPTVNNELLESIWDEDVDQIRSIVAANGSQRFGTDGQMALLASTCSPEITELLVHELGFDVRFADSLGGVVFQAIGVGNDPGDGCAEELVRESLEIMIAAGADPCATADGVALAPFESAAVDGWSDATVAMLRRHSAACS